MAKHQVTSVHPRVALLYRSTSFDITLKCQLTRQEERSSACNTQIISSVTLDDLRDLYSSLKITLMMSLELSWLGLVYKLEVWGF